MPLYEYRCTKCGHQFEKMVRFSDAAQNQECPNCNSIDTKKQVSMISTASSSTLSTGGSCGSSSSSGRFT